MMIGFNSLRNKACKVGNWRDSGTAKPSMACARIARHRRFQQVRVGFGQQLSRASGRCTSRLDLNYPGEGVDLVAPIPPQLVPLIVTLVPPVVEPLFDAIRRSSS